MTLAKFIFDNIDVILDEWERFAISIPSARGLDKRALRDDAKEILVRIGSEMAVPQTDQQQKKKAEARAMAVVGVADTPAQSHGAARFADGFDLKEMLSEYRALRASVIRLWMSHDVDEIHGKLYELTRFNEGIDQAMTESVARFSDQLDRAREIFMGTLGHDLRAPLQVILQSATSLLNPGARTHDHKVLAGYIERSALHVNVMVNSLLDVARTRLGGTLPMEPKLMEAGEVCRAVVQEFGVLHPSRGVRLQIAGDLHGIWDEARLYQLVSNLVRNAIQHGDPSTTVTVTATGHADHVSLSVHNAGEPIPTSQIAKIFDPMTRAYNQTGQDDRTSLGLGLYIADTIARAHRGAIHVESSRELGTSFTVSLPRR